MLVSSAVSLAPGGLQQVHSFWGAGDGWRAALACTRSPFLEEWAAKPRNQWAWIARSCASAHFSCTLKYWGEERNMAARAVQGAKYSFPTNRVQAALRTVVRTEARFLLRKFSRYLLDSVGDRSASGPTQRIARMLEHDRSSIQKVFQTHFPGSAGILFAIPAASDISKLLSATQKCVLVFS